MININLLPPEYRPRSGTPLARFVSIVAGVMLVASATGVYAYTHFIDLARAKELKAAREEESAAKTKLRDRSLALQREISVYEKRRAAIRTINVSRTLWSRKLDQFYDIVTAQDSGEGYLVWLQSADVPVQMATRSRRRGATAAKQPAGELRFDGHVAMDRESEGPALISMFHKALTGDPDNGGTPTEFFADFGSVSNPGIDIQKDGDPELSPTIVGDFKYQLKLHAIDLKAAAKKRAAKAAN